MESIICTQCNIEKHINNFYKKYSACKDCNIRRGVKRYYDNRDKLLQKQNDYSKKKKHRL